MANKRRKGRAGFRPELVVLEDRLVPAGRPLPFPVIAAGTDAGVPAQTRLIDADTGSLLLDKSPFGPGYTGGIRVALGDLTRDGYPDLVVAPASGATSILRVLDGRSGEPVASLDGILVPSGATALAVGDLTGDHFPDITVAMANDSGIRVRVFNGQNGTLAREYRLTDTSTEPITSFAIGDLTGDRCPDLVLGSLSDVQVVNGQTWTLNAGPWDSLPGSAVAVGDLTGDGRADLVTVALESGSIRVRALDGVTGLMVLETAPMLAVAGIATVGLAYVNDDNRVDVVVGAGTSITVLDGSTGDLLPDPRGSHVPFGDGIPLLTVAAANDPYPPYLPAFICPDTAMVGSEVPMSLLVFGGVPDGPEWVTGSVAFTATAGTMEYALGTCSIIPGLESPGEAYATITTNILPPGIYTVTATYSGDDYFLSDSLSGTITIIDSAIAGLQNQPPVDEACCACAGTAGLGGGANGPAPSPRSGSGVAYGSGVIRVDQTGPSIQGGTRLGANWSWSNASGYLDGLSGRNATMGGMPHLTESGDGSTVAMVSSATSARFFDLVDGSYFPRFFDTATLEHDTTAHQLVMQDGAGTTFTWYDFSSSVPSGRSGKLVSMSDSFGNQTQVTGWTAAGNPTGYEQTDGSASRRMSYEYVGAGVNAGNIASISLDEQEGAGPWETVRTVEYAYYGASAPGGSPDELKSVVVKDASGAVVDGSYYRYYTEGNASGLMKFAFGSAAYSRLTGALGTGVDALTDAQVDDYADMALTYDIMGRVSSVVEARAGCSACSGGLGTYTYSYGTSANAEGYNSWDTRTVETLPDGGHIIVYTNAFGQIMLREETDGVTGQARVTYFRYDGAGRLVMSAQPPAVSGYNDSYPDLVDFSDGNAAFLRDDAGLLAIYAYGSETTASGSAPGSVEGRLDTVALRHGEAGTNVPQTTISYVSHTDSAGSVVYAVAQTVSYRSDDGSGAVVSGQSYAYFSGTNQVETVAATNPAVPSTQNGSGISSIITTAQDSHGRPVWTRDAAGVIGYNAYDPISGGVVRTIADVDTSLDADFAGLPSGWSTPAGAGRHLIADFEVDGLGRQTRAIWPDGRIDYTVYNDAAHEVRHYIGWHDGVPTVPTRVEREDRQRGYVESFSMTATPSVSGGRPTGTEAISGLTALTRSVLNAAGQAVARRDYFNLTGLTYDPALALGTSTANYLETVQTYDMLGRLAKTVTPAGTIHRMVFDSASRPLSEWVGTNDSPDDGYWSPSNPAGMVKVAETIYDCGGTGDGLPTQQIRYGGVAGAPDQITDNTYDWRNRLVGTKVGVEATENLGDNRPITVFDYDNANRVIRERVYDSDGVSLTDAAGNLSLPDTRLLRSQSWNHFDDMGRVYLAQTDIVDPNDGTVGGTLSTQMWYNARGLLVKQESPGAPVRKMAYDSMGWLSVEYATDGGGDTGYADALTVDDDTVLEQTETTRDAAGRAR